MQRQPPRVAVFGPQPVLTVTIEARADAAGDDIHLHAGGQGVWVSRSVAELGALPVMCGLVGGETGAVLGGLLQALPGEARLARTAAGSGCIVMDRRTGERRAVATDWSRSPSRHELDDLFSTTCATALGSATLVVCNPFAADALPLEVYRNLVADVQANGTPVIVDLSTPRLDAALEGGPDLVKVNDWELAEFVQGPVGEPAQRRAAVDRLRACGARSVVVTRAGEPAYAVRTDGRAFEIAPPRFGGGSREGCGDTMTGAVAAGWAQGHDWLDALVLGVAAGAANFLRHGLGSSLRPVVEELVAAVRVQEVTP